MGEAQEDQIRSEIYDELYSMLDRGLGKRDAGALIGIIERVIDLHKPEAQIMSEERLADLMTAAEVLVDGRRLSDHDRALVVLALRRSAAHEKRAANGNAEEA